MNTDDNAAGALDGIRVVDLTHALAGPYCTMMLGDSGAEVLKIEMPGGGDESRGWGPPFLEDQSIYFLSANRNKKSVTINLKHEDGKAVLRRLIESADVLVENFTPGVMDRLGFSYEQVRQLSPGLVYCSISGFGQTGPERLRPAYDLIVQGMAGMMSITGQRGGDPTKFGVPIADIVAGMFGAYAVSTALLHRERSGEGQYIDTSMVGGQAAILVYHAMLYFATNEPPGPAGNHHHLIAPYGTFKVGNGHVNIAAGNEGLWEKFCEAVGLERLMEDPRFLTNADRVGHARELVVIIEDHLKAWSVEDVVRSLEEAKVPCGPIYNVGQVFTDPQVSHLGLRQKIQHPMVGEIDQVGLPFRFSATPGGIKLPPPTLGQHTGEVLAALGYTSEQIDSLRERGAV